MFAFLLPSRSRAHSRQALRRQERERQQARLSIETLETRAVLAAVMMDPGGDQQTTLPTYVSGTQFFDGNHVYSSTSDGAPIDFNNDGLTDLVAAGSLRLGNGDGTSAASELSLGVAAFLMGSNGLLIPTTFSDGNPLEPRAASMSAVWDFNDDGFQDILLGFQDATNGPSLSMYLGDGAGNFTLSSFADETLTLPGGVTTSLEHSFSHAALADVNGDGLPDLVAAMARAGFNNEYAVFFGTGAAGVTTGFSTIADSILTTDVTSTTTSPLLADLNGDGALDVITPSAAGVRYFLNIGTGFFAAGTDLASATSTSGANLVAADVNNDGRIDILSSSGDASVLTSSGTLQADVSIYLNTTLVPTPLPPTFAAATALSISSTYTAGALAVADMNLDGELDLVISDVGATTSSYLIALGNGSGTFAAATVFSGFDQSTRGAAGLAVGNYNGDALLDVAMGGRLYTNFPNEDITASYLVGVANNVTFDLPGVAPAVLPTGVQNQPYSFQLTITGGDNTEPYTVTLSPGSNPLPTGLVLSTTGLITGIPTQTGTFQLLIRVTQPSGLMGDTPVTLSVGTAAAIVIQPETLPNGTATVSYAQQLTASGGTETGYTFLVTAGALPAGMTLTTAGLLSGVPAAAGTFSFTVSATDSGSNVGSRNYDLVINALGSTQIVIGEATGGTEVRVFDSLGNLLRSFNAFGSQTHGVSVATGDLNGDLIPDIITGLKDGKSRVRVFDGATGAVMWSFVAFDPAFRGGVTVAAGDVDGDGLDDIIVGAGPGGGPHVLVFNGTTTAIVRSFFAFDASFRGGVTVAAGNFNGDAYDDIVVGSGAGGNSEVRVFDGLTLLPIRTFFAYAGFQGGVNVAAADLDADGFSDIITGAGPGGGPHVVVFDGLTTVPEQSFFPYKTSFRGGVYVAAGDVDGDGVMEIITGPGDGLRPTVRVWDNGTMIRSFRGFDAPYRGGVSL